MVEAKVINSSNPEVNHRQVDLAEQESFASISNDDYSDPQQRGLASISEQVDEADSWAEIS